MEKGDRKEGRMNKEKERGKKGREGKEKKRGKDEAELTRKTAACP